MKDYAKDFAKYEKLFKTKKALEYFLECHSKTIPVWYDIFKYYCPKTGKKNGKINRVDLADRVFSEYVRLFEADEHGICTCVTCGAKWPWYTMQCWHYRTRWHYLTRFDERNCHTQCMRCNVMLNGNYRNYHIWMLNHFEPDVEDWLWTNNDLADYDQWWYEDHIWERNIFCENKRKLFD